MIKMSCLLIFSYSNLYAYAYFCFGNFSVVWSQVRNGFDEKSCWGYKEVRSRGVVVEMKSESK